MELLFIHAGTLGDCVLALHFAAMVRAAHPRAAVAFAGRSSVASLAGRFQLISQNVSFDAATRPLWGDPIQHLASGPNQMQPPAVSAALRGYARVVSFLGGPHEAVSRRLAALCGPGVIAIDPRPNPADPRHITLQWMTQALAQGLRAKGHVFMQPPITVSDRTKYRLESRRRLGISDKRIAIVHPGSGSRAKCCPLAALRLLVSGIASQGCRPVWMIGPDELEREGPGYGRALESSAPWVFEESIEHSAELVAGADVYVGNDSGMTHVAALMGTPTLAIFGPTSPAIWRPLGPCVQICTFPGPDDGAWAREAGMIASHLLG